MARYGEAPCKTADEAKRQLTWWKEHFPFRQFLAGEFPEGWIIFDSMRALKAAARKAGLQRLEVLSTATAKQTLDKALEAARANA